MTKSPSSIDKHVGTRVRARRQIVGLSQERLGDALGVTFQQVQKYEKGTNRISASRLQQIAGLLGVPVAYFFEGAPGAPQSADPSSGELLVDKDGAELLRAFNAVSDEDMRRAIISLATAAAGRAKAQTARRKRA
jgi:transcriptional regulator with XRE-family HTH domain